MKRALQSGDHEVLIAGCRWVRETCLIIQRHQVQLHHDQLGSGRSSSQSGISHHAREIISADFVKCPLARASAGLECLLQRGVKPVRIQWPMGMSKNGGIRNVLFAPGRRIRGPVVGPLRPVLDTPSCFRQGLSWLRDPGLLGAWWWPGLGP